MILSQSFYLQKTLFVAQKLLGKQLVRKMGNKIIRGIITETEAYCGPKDLASHASKGRTNRTEIMFGPAGCGYIYLIYGMYYCLNIVTEKEGYPAAALIRGVKVNGVDYSKTNGPGKLCCFFRIDKKLNGIDMTKKNLLWIENGISIPASQIQRTPRIGVDYAREYKDKKWRFVCYPPLSLRERGGEGYPSYLS